MFETLPPYRIAPEEQAEILDRLIARVAQRTGLPLARLEETNIGQNQSYRVFLQGEDAPGFVLKIVSRRGYPAFDALLECSVLLNSIEIGVCDLVYHEPGDDIVPYGFLMQPWVTGDSVPVDDQEWPFSSQWLADFAVFLRRVREVEVSGFGYLGDGPRYGSLLDYFDNMEVIIDHSFGDVFTAPASIRNLEIGGAVAPGFLDYVFDRVKTLARTIVATPTSVLLHGDMLPSNLIYTEQGPLAVDWDECRSGWWVYEIARTLYYFEETPDLLELFLDVYGDADVSRHDIDVGIRLEHTRQHLRNMCITAFDNHDPVFVGRQIADLVKRVERRLD